MEPMEAIEYLKSLISYGYLYTADIRRKSIEAVQTLERALKPKPEEKKQCPCGVGACAMTCKNLNI